MTLRAGRYELLDTIASGGMATVHLGRAVGAGGFERLVAIKTMHPHLSNEPEFVAMFLDEARLAARIRHLNVVGTIDIQQDELGLLLVMDFIEGPSMGQVLRALQKKQTLLPQEIALRIILDSLHGLDAAHELCGSAGEPLNVVHRDVSPQNILVGVDGIARIMDFGVARAESRISSTKNGDAKGKIAYMAPEQAMQKEMDRRVDVYAAGLVLWEFLTGRRLLRGDSDKAIMHQIFHAQHPAPHEIVPSIPPELSAVVMKAIARERDDRYPTAAAFANDLDQVVQRLRLPVATYPAVGAFVRALNLHKSSSDVVSASRPLPAPSSIRTLPSTVEGSSAPALALATEAPKSDAVVTDPNTASRGGFSTTPTTTVGSAASSRTKMLVGGIGAAVLVGAGLWFALGSSTAKEKPEISAANAGPPASSSNETPTNGGAKPTEPAATAPSSSAVSPKSTKTAASAGTGPAARVPPANTGGPKSPKTFIPKEL